MGQYVYKTVAYGTWVDKCNIEFPEDYIDEDLDNSEILETYYKQEYPLRRLDYFPYAETYEYEDDDSVFIYCKSSEIDADRGYSTYELTNLLVLTDKIKQEQEEISNLLNHLKVEHKPMKWNFVAYYG